MSLIGDAVSVEHRLAVIGRFNERVDAAQQAAEPTKAWVQRSVRREGAPRCPVRLRRVSLELVLRYGDALADLFVQYPDDITLISAYDQFVGHQPPGTRTPIDPVRVLTETSWWIDEWGTRWQHTDNGAGAAPVAGPITDLSKVADYVRGQMPDAEAPGRLDGAVQRLSRLGQRQYIVADMAAALWERYMRVRGMGAALEDVADDAHEMGYLLDALVEFHVALIRRWGGLGQVDAIQIADEFGWQRSLLMSRSDFQRTFAARYRAICDAAHEQGMAIVFHSCGNIAALIGDLIDVGVDVIDPLQSEALDLVWVAREYGGKVAFQGGLPEQTLQTMTPSEIRDEVRRLIDVLGSPFGNAYTIAPSNLILEDVPFDNLVAMFEACHQQ